MLQVWDWLFKSCEVNGRILLRDGLVTVKDIEECILKGNCKKLGIQLPAWSRRLDTEQKEGRWQWLQVKGMCWEDSL